jgi:thiol:disulfide interchange protein
MLQRIAYLAAIALFLAATPAVAQSGDVPGVTSKLPPKFRKLADVKLEVVPAKAKWGETVIVKLTIELEPGEDGHTYPFFPTKYPGQEAKNNLALPKPSDAAAGGLIFLEGVADPSSPELHEKQRDGAPPGVMDQYYTNPVTWEFKAVVSPKAPVGKKEVGLGKTSLQVCNATNCIPAWGDKLPTAPFEVLEGTPDKVSSADLAAAIDILIGRKSLGPIAPNAPENPGVRGPANPPPAPVGPAPAIIATPPTSNDHDRKTAKPIDVYTADLAAVQSTIQKPETHDGINGRPEKDGLWGFVLTAALWGLISLVTPCVFPMIPITVSIFLKHAQGSLRERLKLAGVYCLTIISVLGVSAFALLKFMAWLSTNPVTNILLGSLFLVLALSLFGMYELMLPNFMSRRLQAKQAKGGVVGTIFGALAFTVISFTCVAPFLGGFAGISSADAGGGSLIAVPTIKEIAGGLAFATAFAAPFFILALIPGLLKSLPRSGGWLDSVKVVMGFLELAAALKFFRTAEIRIFPTSEYFTYDLVLGGWVAISFACGLYLLNAYRLPHDEEKPNIGVMRLLFALLFLGLGIYLLPATFKGADGSAQRPSGVVYAWVEAFLLPEADKGGSGGSDLKETLERARKSGRPVFLDFTGKTCTNCKYNEHSVFPQQSVRSELEQFERVQLYTDEVPAHAYATDPGNTARNNEGEANRKFQEALFGDIALPLYAVLVPQPDGKVKLLDTREGKINDPGAFAAWLKDSLEVAKKN